MITLRRTAVASMSALALGLAACGGGGGSDSDDVKDVATKLANADPAVCTKVTDDFLKQVGGSKEACEKGAKASKTPHAKVSDVKVDGKKATAVLSQGGSKATIRFTKDGDDWKVSGAK